jgi:hypothetical protein
VELISVDSDIEFAPFKTKPGLTTGGTVIAVAVDKVLKSNMTTNNVIMEGADAIVKGEGNVVMAGIKGMIIGDNNVLENDGIITPQINGIAFQSRGYVALLNQVGTSDPTVIEFSNTIGQITWTRTKVGEYLGTPLIPLNALTTFITIGNTEHDYLASAYIDSSGDIVVRTTKTSNHQHTDGRLINSPIEIRVYE